MYLWPYAECKKLNHQYSHNTFAVHWLFVLRFYGPVNPTGSWWFVCVEVLRPSQPNGVIMSVVSLPNHTFTGQAKSSKWLTSIVHILSPETDNCPFWSSRRERMNIENISWSISMKECCRPGRGRTHNLLITSRMCIQLSHRGRLLSIDTFNNIQDCVGGHGKNSSRKGVKYWYFISPQ